MTTFNLPDLGEGLPEAEIVAGTSRSATASRSISRWSRWKPPRPWSKCPRPTPGRIATLHGKPATSCSTGSRWSTFEVDGANGGGCVARKAAAATAPKVDPRKADDSGTVVGNMPTSDEVLDRDRRRRRRQCRQARARTRRTAVRALAKRLGVDLTHVRASGRGGLITLDDVMSAAARRPPRARR